MSQKLWCVAVVLLLVAVSPFVPARSRAANGAWTLVYANDDRGRRVSGDIGNLIASVRRGDRIRIGWTIQSPSNAANKVEHVADATFLTILSDDTVFAQIDPIVGQTPSVSDRFVTLKENVQWSFSASTRGEHDSMNRNVATGEVVDHQKFNAGIKWFAER
jgi:hypothetical protein